MGLASYLCLSVMLMTVAYAQFNTTPSYCMETLRTCTEQYAHNLYTQTDIDDYMNCVMYVYCDGDPQGEQEKQNLMDWIKWQTPVQSHHGHDGAGTLSLSLFVVSICLLFSLRR